MTDDIEPFNPSKREEAAITFQIRHHTVVLCNSSLTACGTGVCVKLATKHLIATAAHVLDEAELRAAKMSDSISLRGLRSIRHPTADIAAVEIPEPEAARLGCFLNEKPRIHFRWPCMRDVRVMLAGFPLANYLQVSRGECAAPLNVFHSELVAPRDWPKDWPDYCGEPILLNRDLDILCQYPDVWDVQQNSWSSLSLNGPHSLSASPHPGGLSGAGLWLGRFNRKRDTSLTYPAASLLGIQSGYSQQERLLRATKISVLLDELAKCDEEIAEWLKP